MLCVFFSGDSGDFARWCNGVGVEGSQNIAFYTTFTNFSTIYLMMCEVYTNEGGIK